MRTPRVQGLLRYVLRILGKRSYSTLELRRKLDARWKLVVKNQKVADTGNEDHLREPEIAQVMEYLSTYQLLDDQAYAQIVATGLQHRHKSQTYIRQKLKLKGLDPSLLEIPPPSPQTEDEQSLDYLIQRKLEREPRLLADLPQKMKLKRWLFSRGFRYEDIERAIKLVPVPSPCEGEGE